MVAGDAIYNGVHQYLAESADGGLRAWMKALDMVAALEPRSVVAGHKNKGLHQVRSTPFAKSDLNGKTTNQMMKLAPK